jgi:hypothetical protein
MSTSAAIHVSTPGDKISLFHFTRPEYLPSILNHGLDTGEVPLNDSESINAVCLTADDNAKSQSGWTSFLPQKSSIRLKVSLVKSDPLLITLKFFPKHFRIEPRWFKTLTGPDKANVYKWYVYLGTIAPSSITEVWDAAADSAFSETEIQKIKRLPERRGQLVIPIRMLSIEEARR